MELVIVKLLKRQAEAIRFQEVLTKHGCDITLRLGLHETGDQTCSEEGVIILQVKPERQAVDGLLADLKSVGPIEVKAVSL